ncbi:ORF6N domain-containing protein, partial [Xenorhabdus bovienii]
MTAIMHNSIPVITTELLADIYETDVINIQVNHSRNKDRFV